MTCEVISIKPTLASSGSYTRGLLGQASAPKCPRRYAVVGLEKRPGLALLAPGCREQTSGLPGLTPVRLLPAHRLVHHRQEEAGMHLGYLRAVAQQSGLTNRVSGLAAASP